MAIQMAFDHRVFDGVTAGRVGGLLEDVFNNELVDEVNRQLSAAPRPHDAS
jgi:hypothetical protein